MIMEAIYLARPKLTEFDKRLRSEIARSLKSLSGNYTQQELSEKTGIPASTLSGYFNETSTINPKNLQILARFFNVPEGTIDPRSRLERLNETVKVTEYDDSIKKMRISHDWSQQKLADKTGIPLDKIKAYESHELLPSHLDYLTLEGAFNRNVAFMSLGESERRLLGLSIDRNVQESELLENQRLEAEVISATKTTLLAHGYTLYFKDNDDRADFCFIREEATGIEIRIESVDIFEIYESLKEYLFKSADNFLNFKIKELKTRYMT